MNPNYLLLLVFITACIGLSYSDGRSTDSDYEINDNLLDDPTPMKNLKRNSGSLLASFIHDPTVPVFLVMGLASLASAFTASKNNTESFGRIKRSTSNSSFSSNLLRILGNVQKAVEKYQQLEIEIANELDEDIGHEYAFKSD